MAPSDESQLTRMCLNSHRTPVVAAHMIPAIQVQSEIFSEPPLNSFTADPVKALHFARLV